MRLRRFLAVLDARNKEFWRDRATLGWNLGFPILVLFGMAFIFSGRGQLSFKVAVLGEAPQGGFFATEHADFIAVDDLEDTLDKLGKHQFDMVVDAGPPRRYWINETSATGAVLERLLAATAVRDSYGNPLEAAGAPAGRDSQADDAATPGGEPSRPPSSLDPPPGWHKGTVEGRELRYVEWMLPGLLAMNAMFSCLFGVGFVIVRYRKNGVLRRLEATPLTAFEFLSAQVVSRMLLVLFTTALVYVGTDLLLDFHMAGSYLDLVFVFALGTFCLVTLGLAISARTASEELAGGLLNVATWPMMLLGGVWFSLEGSPRWVQAVAKTLPLTHLSDAARAIMNDGAGLSELVPQITYLSVTSLVLLAVGSMAFRWE